MSGRSATMTAREVASVLGVSEWLVYDRVRKNDFPIPWLNVGRKLLFTRHAVRTVVGPLPDEDEAKGDQ